MVREDLKAVLLIDSGTVFSFYNCLGGTAMGRDKYNRRPPVLPIRDKVLIMCGGQTEVKHGKNYTAYRF